MTFLDKLTATATAAVLAIASLLLGACASTPNTISNTDPSVDFSQYSTYGFFDPLATDDPRYESLVSNFLKVAVSQQMAQRGIAYAEDPDLLVNFYIHTQEKVRSRSVPTMGGYYDYRDPFGYDPWPAYPAYETRIDQYTEGTLNIDVVDARSQKLIWEGMVSGRVTESDVSNLEQTIDEAVAAVMSSFPVQPVGAAGK
jgi:hypothetical protein